MLERGRAGVANRPAGLGLTWQGQVALAGAGRADQQEATRDLAPHVLEVLDALEQRNDPAGRLDDLGVAAIVLERDASLAGLDPVDAPAAQEPEDCDELDDRYRDHQYYLERVG